MSIEKIIVKERKITGKEETGRIKRSGLVPAVVYGLKKGSIPLSVSPKEIVRVFQSEKGLNSLMELSMEGTSDSAYVMIKDLARHPVTDRLVHVDFLRVDMDKEIESTVPVVYTGIAEGTKLGGILQVVRREILVVCLPRDLPGSLEISVEALELDESLRVQDITFPEGVKPLIDLDRVLAVVHAIQEEVEEVEEEEIIEGEDSEDSEESTEESTEK